MGAYHRVVLHGFLAAAQIDATEGVLQLVNENNERALTSSSLSVLFHHAHRYHQHRVP